LALPGTLREVYEDNPEASTATGLIVLEDFVFDELP
jgi:hypothetical protein